MPHFESGVISVNSKPISDTLEITKFTNDKSVNLKGSVVTAIRFNWSFFGNPDSQRIEPFIGEVPNNIRSFTLSEQDITNDTIFTLKATQGNITKSIDTSINFYYPVYFGLVNTTTPTASELLSLSKAKLGYDDFIADLIIDDQRTCICAPLSNPITDIRDTLFNTSVLDTFISAIVNIPLLSGLPPIPCKVWIKSSLENTLGNKISYKFVF